MNDEAEVPEATPISNPALTPAHRDITAVAANAVTTTTPIDPPVDPRLRVIGSLGGVSAQEILQRLERPILVHVGGAPPLRRQLLALTLVDLLGRLFPNITIDCGQTTAVNAGLPPGPSLLAERFRLAREHGHPATGDPIDSAKPIEVVLGDVVIGRPADVYIDGDGWQSYTGTQPSELPTGEGSALPIGPLCAAARGAAQVFQIALDGLLPHGALRIECCYWSALDFRSDSAPLVEPELPLPTSIEAVFAGLGSVGGSAVYLLRHMPELDGFLALIDPQALEEHNYVRALLASYALAQARAQKASVAADALAHHQSLHLEPRLQRFEEFVAEQDPDHAMPLVVCSVDSIASRRAIQDCMPLEIINAACSATDILCSSHRTDDGPCLYCMYIEQVLDKEAVLVRRISRATGFAVREVAERLLKNIALSTADTRTIAVYRGLDTNFYDRHAGLPLLDFYRSVLTYGETLATTAGGAQVAVASPFVTALAGFILASEALKACEPILQPYRLGQAGSLRTPEGATPTKYEEPVLRSPADAWLLPVPRSTRPSCLCQSLRRIELMHGRYGTAA